MYKYALTAVEQSSGDDGRAVWCVNTEDNVRWLRRWSGDAARVAAGYGETHYPDRWEFRGWDHDHEGNEVDWCVAIEPPEVEP